MTVFPIVSGFVIFPLILAGLKILKLDKNWWLFTVILLLGYVLIVGSEIFSGILVFSLIFAGLKILKFKKGWWIFITLTAGYFFVSAGNSLMFFDACNQDLSDLIWILSQPIAIIVAFLLLSDTKEFLAKKNK